MAKIINKLCEWLDATTTYDSTENRDRSAEQDLPKWRTFYQYGPVLVENEKVLAPEEQTTYHIARKHVAHNQSVQPGDIISSGNGQRYLVQPNGSLRKCTATKS